ncbi:MAG TPA: hypothetical protein VF148_17980 [Acidimicrobiia bacterium]
MAYLRFGLAAVNALAFIVLFTLTVRFMNRERSNRAGRLGIVVALAAPRSSWVRYSVSPSRQPRWCEAEEREQLSGRATSLVTHIVYRPID